MELKKMNAKEMSAYLNEQKKLGYPNFKNKIVKVIVEKYQIEEELAREYVFNSRMTQKIDEDIYWSQHMGPEFWAEFTADMIKAKK